MVRINFTSLALMMPSGAVHPIIPGRAEGANRASAMLLCQEVQVQPM